MREIQEVIAELIGQCADIRVTYDSVQRQYTHVANADELAASIMRLVKARWRPIAELPDELKDGRPVLLWASWAKARVKMPAAFGDQADEPVTAKWYSPGTKPVPDRGYWMLIQTGGYAEDDETSGDITHFAEIEGPK